MDKIQEKNRTTLVLEPFLHARRHIFECRRALQTMFELKIKLPVENVHPASKSPKRN